MAFYKAWPRIWNQDYQETNPTGGRVEALKAGPPDYNTSALNHAVSTVNSANNGLKSDDITLIVHLLCKSVAYSLHVHFTPVCSLQSSF